MRKEQDQLLLQIGELLARLKEEETLFLQIAPLLARVEEILNKRQEGPGCWANAPGMTLPTQVMGSIENGAPQEMIIPGRHPAYPLAVRLIRRGQELVLEFSIAGYTWRRSFMADGPLD